ncbi:enoyl-CoA hydratase [Neobacillus niacini]|uniref:enoyl-CoA hydratase/isomerase family protein n=1 Tax=Neobacillus niacini TaxID=86668 RepID=UPI002785916A|nr:enoyl-CoA hydratase-related protein [Neobacillus niacini]MDQ1002657.1 enoyl-CoA hydratase [Neobacillus niacini]
MGDLLIDYKGESNQILTVTLNRPEVMNALNTQLFQDMLQLFREQSHNEELRCIVLTGAGGKAFCSGGDLKERNGMSNEDWKRQHHLIEEVFLCVRDFPLPVITAVEGYAFAGGCELALMTDFIIASETARFALTETTRGIMPGGGGLQNLPRSIGIRRAKELIFTGRNIDAHLAYEWGLVNRVVPKGKAMETALELAVKIADSAPLSTRMAKMSMNRGTEVDFHTGYALDIAAYNVLVPTEDRLEGIAAFNEKRKPKWKNR